LRTGNSLSEKLITSENIKFKLAQLKMLGKTIAFTNGCFDILHAGHIASLAEAAKHADVLIVGLNSDSSVTKLKGSNRPLNNELSRAQILASLTMVDIVIIFEEDTPESLIKIIKPDVLVKGGDYKVEDIAGAKDVLEAGGKIILNPIEPGFSTSDLIKKIQSHN
jgi:D-beta-D-heptose 7-phosphate kinase/D-beta-D-heptose 1-phosphate adenosyltransferase